MRIEYIRILDTRYHIICSHIDISANTDVFKMCFLIVNIVQISA